MVRSTANTDTADNKSHQIIVLLGRQRSANVPPMNENTKIGANSATLISEMAYGSLLVLSATYSRIAKLRTQIPICRSTLDNNIVCRNRLLRRLGAFVLFSCLFNLFNLHFSIKMLILNHGMTLLSFPNYTDLIIVHLRLKTDILE